MKAIKKVLCLILTVLMAISTTGSVMASDNIKVRLGGKLIDFDVQPQLINDRTMVPLRAIFEALGATVDWNGDTQTVTSTKGNTTIKLAINNPTMYVNDEPITLDSPACLVDGRTLVPVRAISEAFNLKVEWDGATKTVCIKQMVSVIAEEFCMITDFVAQRWRYTYDDSGFLVSAEHDAGLKVLYEYDLNGNLIRETFNTETPKGVVTSYTEYTYDSNNNLLLETDEYGWTKYEYDNNRLKSWSNYNGASCNYTYDSDGRLIMETYGSGSWTKYEYDTNGLLIKETTSYNTEYIYKYESGNLKTLSMFDSDGKNIYTKTYEYDADNNLIFASDTDGSWEKYILIEK